MEEDEQFLKMMRHKIAGKYALGIINMDMDQTLIPYLYDSSKTHEIWNSGHTDKDNPCMYFNNWIFYQLP